MASSLHRLYQDQLGRMVSSLMGSCKSNKFKTVQLTPFATTSRLLLCCTPQLQRTIHSCCAHLSSCTCYADIAAGVMGTEAVDAGLPLMEQGLDSLAAVELRNGAAAAFGVQLGAAVALDHPTLEVICRWDSPAFSMHAGVSDQLQLAWCGETCYR